MKKGIIILLALVSVAGLVFAQDAAPTAPAVAQSPAVKITADASLIWGYNLNTDRHGFVNTANASISLPLIAKQSSTNGQTPITGVITVKDLQLVLGATYKDNGTPKADMSTDGVKAVNNVLEVASVSARILFPYALFIEIYKKPDMSINTAERHSSWVSDKKWDDDYLVAPGVPIFGGFTFGMSDSDTDGFNFALKVGSTDSYKDIAPMSIKNDYALALDLGYKLGKMLNAGLKVLYGPFTKAAKDAGVQQFGAGLSLTSSPVTGLDLALGFDVKHNTNEPLSAVATTDMDLKFDVGYTMADMFKASAGTYVYLPVLPKPLANAQQLDFWVRFDLLIHKPLTFAIGADFWDVLDSPASKLIQVGAKLAYSIDLGEAKYIKPYLNGGYVIAKEAVIFKMGVDVGVIPLTTFTLDYTAGLFNPNLVDATKSAFVAGKAGLDKGLFTFTTKIKY